MKRFSVFIVDADEAVRESVGWLLDAAGIPAQTFGSAVAFLGAFRRTQATSGCVIADTRLPKIGGLELQRILVELGCTWPVIMTSGRGEVQEAVQTLKAGAVDYIEKPTGAGTLLQRVEEVVWQLQRQPAGLVSHGDVRLPGPHCRTTLRFDDKGRPIEPVVAQLDEVTAMTANAT